jgi:hypothetical protein
MQYLIIGCIVIIILVLYNYRRELFGESIYVEADFDIRGDSEKRPAIFTSGATQRAIGQMFSSTNQSRDRTY